MNRMTMAEWYALADHLEPGPIAITTEEYDNLNEMLNCKYAPRRRWDRPVGATLFGHRIVEVTTLAIP